MNTYMLKLAANGEITREPFSKITAYSTMSGIVGGYVETFPVRESALRGFGFYCNEEGKLEGLEPNAIASGLYGRIIDGIVGDVGICKTDRRGDWLGLTEAECKKVEECLVSHGATIKQ